MKTTQIHINNAILALLLFAGCSQQRPSEYYPVPTKGEIREYSVELFARSQEATKGKLTERVEGEIDIKGKKYLKVVRVTTGFPPPNSPEIEFVRYTKEGIYIIKDSPDGNEYLETPFPIAVGKQWSYTTTEGTTEWKAEAIEDLYLSDRTIKDCLKISGTRKTQDGVTMTSTVYLAPKYGIVKFSGSGSSASLEMNLINPVVK